LILQTLKKIFNWRPFKKKRPAEYSTGLFNKEWQKEFNYLRNLLAVIIRIKHQSIEQQVLLKI